MKVEVSIYSPPYSSLPVESLFQDFICSWYFLILGFISFSGFQFFLDVERMLFLFIEGFEEKTKMFDLQKYFGKLILAS